MKWRNALRDELPEHGQVVLVSFQGIYYVMVFDAALRRFYFHDDPSNFIAIESEPFYWIEM